MKELNESQKVFIENSKKHQERIIKNYLEKSPPNPATFEVYDLVLVAYPVRPPNKLFPYWKGPYRVLEKIRTNVYLCKHLTNNVIRELDVARLKLFIPSGLINPVEVAVLDVDNDFVIDHIKDHRGNTKRTLKFLVKWAGYGDEDNSWEPLKNLEECIALDDYVAIHPELRTLVGEREV